MMLFVQVILGGSYIFLGGPPILTHIYWGLATLIVLIIATALARRDYGTSSNLFKVAIVAIADFVLQAILGFTSFNAGLPVVVHLTNAFVLAILVTYLISFADSGDKSSRTRKTTPGKMPSI
jgi:heme A synthase